MVRFSCFPSHIHCHKQKKSVQLSAEAMHKTLEDCSRSQASKNSTYLAMTNPSDLNMEGDTSDNSAYRVTDSYPIEQDWNSEQIERISNIESDIGVRKTACIKKSMSLGSGLDRKGKVSGGNESEDETDPKFSCNGSLSHSELVVQDSSKDFKFSTANLFQEAVPSDSLQENAELVNIESIFSIADPQQSGKEGQENYDLQLSGAGESDDRTPRTPPNIVKSRSLPNMHSPVHFSTCSLHRSRSAEDLNVIDSRRKDMSTYETGMQVIQQEERDDSALNNGKSNWENAADDSYDAYNYVGSAKEWIVPVADEVTNNNYQGKSSFCRWDKLPSKDFKIKRIQEWVIDLQHYSPLETSESSPSNDHEEPKNETVLDSPAARLDGKVNPSMEAVKRYLSSLSATSTAAQFVNHGLVVIPFLSAFTSLRALNLSGNAIVRITAGSLPRGLHVLNLSKNNISTIEGLRELTRLRILDLSYNRILRIGHGLASCSSLKELYLAGNKISEVEGLHRLLKLNVLDLRFNKISTTKCLGQLAANYNSLQAIGLDGNPAQKNIGDEHLKKYLQGLLPHLAYYNRQPIKVGTLKDTADRSARVGISSHQIERNLRSELKTIRKGSHGVAPHKASSSSIHGRKTQAVPSSKASKSRNGRLPPSGTKISTDRHHVYDFSSKLLNFKSHLSIHKSRSEGTLAAL